MASDEDFVIERAVRQQALLRLAISAVSGAGKTMGGLRLARGICEYMIEQGLLHGTIEGKVGVVDTERNSASLYAHLYPFDRISLTPPYTVARYLGAARALANAGKAVILIDQISHQWAGQGGMLEFVDLIRQRGSNKNDFSAWSEATPEQNEFLEGLLGLPCHLICTMRAKTAYVMEEKTRRDGSKYSAPRRVGLKPVQRDGVEYEFTTVMDLELDTKTATVSKDRTGLFVDPASLKSKTFLLTEDVGKELARWLLSGAPDTTATTATDLERCQASAASWIRQIEACTNLPDLARIWDSAQKELRGFASSVDRTVLDALIADAKAAKESRKLVVAPQPITPAGPVLDIGVISDLERFLQDAGVPLERCLQHFGVQRLVLLPKSKGQAVVDWAIGEALDAGHPLPTPAPRLREAGFSFALPPAARAGHFDDMKDDLPWPT